MPDDLFKSSIKISIFKNAILEFCESIKHIFRAGVDTAHRGPKGQGGTLDFLLYLD